MSEFCSCSFAFLYILQISRLFIYTRGLFGLELNGGQNQDGRQA
jgi:hypothetical protein